MIVKYIFISANQKWFVFFLKNEFGSQFSSAVKFHQPGLTHCFQGPIKVTAASSMSRPNPVCNLVSFTPGWSFGKTLSLRIKILLKAWNEVNLALRLWRWWDRPDKPNQHRKHFSAQLSWRNGTQAPSSGPHEKSQVSWDSHSSRAHTLTLNPTHPSPNLTPLPHRPGKVSIYRMDWN